MDREEEGATVEALQDAFDEPGVPDAERAASEAAWPQEDREGITDTSTVGFGLFRGQPSSASATPSAGTAEVEQDEEPLLWFGDEFDAAQLEVAAEGWRDEQRPAAGRGEEAQPAGGAPAPEPSDADLERIAADEGWDRSEVDAMRSYLDRTSGQVADESPSTEPGPPVIVEPPPAPSTEASGPPARSGPPADQDWLRGRRGSAAGAYRRLRRLFDS